MQNQKGGFSLFLSMTLENKIEHQMGSFSVCFLRIPVPWIAVLVPIFIYLSISGSGYFSFLITSLLWLFSAFFLFKFTKQKQVIKDHESLQVQVQALCSEQSLDYKVEESPDLYSESEVIDQYSSSDDSDIDWPFSGNVAGSPDFSDGSISDEESLIEITLPSGDYVESKEEEDDKLKWGLQRKFQDFSAEAIFGKRSLMEMLAEINDMNEEDNLIEIDLSMGSIKCSRFEIEA